jgi:hypothetical protein
VAHEEQAAFYTFFAHFARNEGTYGPSYLSAGMFQLENRWADFDGIWY